MGQEVPVPDDPSEVPPQPSPQPLPKSIDFYTFCLSLGSSAFVHLGDAPHPEVGSDVENLTLAKQTIDILAMLQEKTRGNLSSEEAQFLDHLVVDLKLRYVQRSRGYPATIVNGEVFVENGSPTGAHAGRTLRS